jgi:SAM-dependent methyltransferase
MARETPRTDVGDEPIPTDNPVMSFINAYSDARRADAYAELEFPGTYYLAFRDLPGILSAHAPGRAALDFGCGAGRSTRFLRRQGFLAIGVDISDAMLAKARECDPCGAYLLVGNGDLRALAGRTFDVVFSSFTFDNIPGRRRKVGLFRQFRELLGPGGVIVNLVSTPDIYTHEWASFSTKDFPGNLTARPGDVVRTVITDVRDPRPVDDILWPDEAYRDVYDRAGLDVVAEHVPLATGREPIEWVSETEVGPWKVYVLAAR